MEKTLENMCFSKCFTCKNEVFYFEIRIVSLESLWRFVRVFLIQ